MQALWIGRDSPPAPLSTACRRRDWALLAAGPEDATTAVTAHQPDAVIVGVVETDFDALRAAAPATPIAYCPPETTADGVAAAAAADVDVVLPQDAEAWDPESVLRRLADTESGGDADQPAADQRASDQSAADQSVSTDGAGPTEATRNGGADGTAAAFAERDRTDLRREHDRLRTLFENLPDPVVDTEHNEDGPVILAANDAFADVFDCDREAIVGEPIDEVLSSPGGAPTGSMPPGAINEQVSDGEVTGAKVQRETEQGTRTFLFRGIPYAQDDSVRAFGIYTDVTDIERRERHVKVLDRLLRHNLRNDLGIVIGRAENVLERTEDPAIREEATRLVEAANDLIDLSDTAKRIRRIIEEPSAERSSIPVAPLFEGVAADANGRFPEASVDVVPGDDFAVLATSDVRLALAELVENAIVHGGGAVELRAEAFAPAPSTWIDLLVIDGGAGIPETERAAVTGDRDITQLQHGSGLGLWLVRWAVESVGGDLGFERRDGRTVVRIRLRRAEAE